MSGSRVLKREISFYSIQAVTGTGRKKETDSTFDWSAFVEQMASQPELVTEAREKLRPLRVRALGQLPVPALAIYRPVDNRFWSQGDPDGLSIQDLELEQGFELLNATAFFFLPQVPGLVCMLQGDPQTGSPAIRTLQSFAALAAPQSGGARWTTTPVRVESQIEELRRADGISRFRLKGTGGPGNIFAGNAELSKWRGFRAIGDYFGSRIGTDVEVTVTVQLPKALQTADKQRTFRDTVLADADTASFDDDRISVRATTRRDGQLSEETLTLAQHDLTSKVEIEVPEGEAVRFSALVDETARDLAVNGEKYAMLAVRGSHEEPKQDQ